MSEATGAERQDEIRLEIAALVSEYATIEEDDDGPAAQPFVTGWALVYEYASVELEREHAAGRGLVIPQQQMLSASLGLLRWGARAFH